MANEVIFRSNLVAVKREIRQQLKKNIQDATEYLKNKIKGRISRYEGGGRIYFSLSKRDEHGKLVFKHIHKASAPGEPPVKFTGKLYRSIQNDVRETAYEIEGRVYSTDPKARSLEFGDFGRNLAKRPFFRPTFEENKERILEILNRNVEERYIRRSKVEYRGEEE